MALEGADLPYLNIGHARTLESGAYSLRNRGLLHCMPLGKKEAGGPIEAGTPMTWTVLIAAKPDSIFLHGPDYEGYKVFLYATLLPPPPRGYSIP